MGSTMNRQKLSSEQNVKQLEDRISNLPSDLIGHILSFLPTNDAVATSILSTTWKLFWTLITSLNFDDANSTTLPETVFMSFVSRVLLLRRVSCLHKFCLRCLRRYDVLHVNAWAAACLMRGVQELDLSIPMKHSPDVLPRDLFSCRTLVVVKLGTQFDMNVPNSVCLLSLKTLHLDTVKLLDDDSIKRLFIGCPVLEELSMRACVGKDVHVIHICAPVLKRLIIYWLPYDGANATDFFKYKIVLDTPALLHLNFNDYVAECYFVKNLCHLIEADINIVAPINEPLDHFEPIHVEAITDLLASISKVRCLYLTGFGMEAIHLSNCQLPVFHDATCLELGVPEDFVGWAVLPELLKNSPRLETVIFNEGIGGDNYPFGKPLHCYLPQYGLPCSLLHLKIIEIWSFEGTEEELEMVKYFLKNAKVLEMLTVHYNRSQTETNVNHELEVSKKLLMLPRASVTCQIELL